jgi:hypothetical protein
MRITDNSLFKRLGIIILVGATYLAAWTGIPETRPRKEYKKDANNLKYETCLVTFWNYISMSSEYCLQEQNENRAFAFALAGVSNFFEWHFCFISSTNGGSALWHRAVISSTSCVNRFQRDQADHVGHI